MQWNEFLVQIFGAMIQSTEWSINVPIMVYKRLVLRSIRTIILQSSPELYNFLTPLSSFTPQSTCPNNYVFLSTRCARVPSIPALFRYSSFLTPSKRVALTFGKESMTISFKKRQASQLGLVEDFRLRTLYFVLFYF